MSKFPFADGRYVHSPTHIVRDEYSADVRQALEPHRGIATCSNRPTDSPPALAYGARAADTLLPNVLTFKR